MIGKQFGHYEIVGKLGQGGMGAVYRAHDSRLQRDVALKVLPPEVVTDPERLARFDREAQLLAQLNHPNIGSIYGLERSGDERALVLELIEGPTLAERIAPGPIQLEEALRLAGQIALALEAAHERGIVHRDLKPDNIKLTEGNAVKVLDFGLAKATAAESRDARLSQSPTITALATQHGVILGTAAYMPPEQARGHDVDRRADVWAFGCVLMEMLTGRQTFAGDTITDVLAAVVRETPNWDALPKETPAGVRRLLRRCLEKDPQKRLRDMGDVWLLLEEAGTTKDETSASMEPTSRRSLLPWSVAVVALALAAYGLVGRGAREAAPGPEVIRHLAVPIPGGQTVGKRNAAGPVVMAPDGTWILYSVGDENEHNVGLFRLDLATGASAPLQGSEGGHQPVFSPDGKSIAFNTDNDLRRMPAQGGPATTLGPAQANRGIAWGHDGTIYFPESQEGPLMQVSAQGGPVTAFTTLAPNERSHRWPCLLPDGSAIFYVVEGDTLENFSDAKIVLRDLATGETQTVVERGAFPMYVEKTDQLIYWHDRNLFAIPFDPATHRVTGPARLAMAEVGGFEASGAVTASVTSQGGLLYLPPTPVPPSQLVWMSADAGVEAVTDPMVAQISDPQIAPDGRRLALSIDDELYTFDLERSILTQVTFTGAGSPVWSPEGTRIAFGSQRGGLTNWNLFVLDLDDDAEPRRVTTSVNHHAPNDWSHDGRWLAFAEFAPDAIDLWTLDIDAGTVEPLLATEFEERDANFSPDDRWFAYVSMETGAEEVFVRPFRRNGPKVRVSPDGGREPRWSSDGKNIYYRKGTEIMSIDVQETNGTLRLSRPSGLFVSQFLGALASSRVFGVGQYDVMTKGRFLMVRPLEEQHPIVPRLVENFTAKLR